MVGKRIDLDLGPQRKEVGDGRHARAEMGRRRRERDGNGPDHAPLLREKERFGSLSVSAASKDSTSIIIIVTSIIICICRRVDRVIIIIIIIIIVTLIRHHRREKLISCLI